MKNYVVAMFILFLMAGCQTTQVRQATFEASTVATQTSKPEFVYNPEGKEQFVFNEKLASLQKYGYRNFCKSTKTCLDRLPYEKYVGMKGYFDTEEPIKKDYSGYEFYPVILENGEKYYFVANDKYGGKYGPSSPIISLEDYEILQSFSPEPLIPGSTVELVGNEIVAGMKFYGLSNGKKVSENDLDLIREVCNHFGNKPEMAELLLDMKIDKDEVDRKYFISPRGNILRSEAKLYIGFNDMDKWLRFKVKYYGDNWLFVNSYKIAADDYRWQSPRMVFKRDHSSGSVWEWIDVPASKQEIEIAKALAYAETATIRFQGSKYYSDKQLKKDQKESIKKILNLFSLMDGV